MRPASTVEVDVAERGEATAAAGERRAVESVHDGASWGIGPGVRVVDRAEVRLGDPDVGADRGGVALGDDLPEVEDVDVVAEAEHERDVVVDEQDAGAGVGDGTDALAEPLGSRRCRDPAAGSSSSRTLGSAAHARAIDTSWRSPWLRSPAARSRARVMPDGVQRAVHGAVRWSPRRPRPPRR